MTNVLGIHHVSTVASDPQRNIDFFAGLLGLRLVKRTVNFDDPETYHLYYGDEVGTPGCIMTFFPWPGAKPGRQGPGECAVVSFSVLPSAIGFWLERFVRHGVTHERPAARGSGDAAERVLAFRDHDGALYELVGHEGAASRPAWTEAPGIPAEHTIHGFHGVTLWVEEGEQTERVLVDTLGFRATSEWETTKRYVAGDGGPGRIVDVRSVGGFMRGAKGAGIVHHVAFEVADDQAEREVREQVIAAGLHPTEVIDRNYFHSVYFREPGGVLYELATTPPGFTVDEPVEHLGERLMLPSQYEPNRAQIEAVLPPIHLPAPARASDFFATMTGPEDVSGDALGFVHRYLPPASTAEAAGATTLLMLHGTGGDEEDLIPLGRSLLPGAGILSPRGQVLEGGAPRFFRRLAPGVFDLEDLARRTDELAEFIDAAAKTYRLDRSRIIAAGFSNGANIAASLLLRRGAVVRGAVLLSPMLPFEPESLPDLSATSVFIGAGERDPMASRETVEQLARALTDAGAQVTTHWTPVGHTVTKEELDAARSWLDKLQ
ncbi:MAG: VOC family protein [Gemmatimonadetes bacterium]|nr:VOC family protein [Gemmatimonadota bacterium]